MKKIFMLLTLLCMYASMYATAYYFNASTGNDSRSSTQAQSPTTPWQSIDRLNRFFPSLLPGDTVLFYRGQEFPGTIRVKKSGTAGAPIVISAYGSGSSLPAISGWSYPTGWVNTSGGIWKANCPTCKQELNTVLINNVPYAKGRYPNKDATNKGYLMYETFSGSNQLTDNELSGSPNWAGAEAVVRARRWTLDRDSITSHSTHTLQFVSGSDYDLEPGYGYFIQNSINTLDQFGEWYYERDTPKVAIYTGATNPSGYSIAVSTQDTLVALNHNDYIEFKNLNFTGANKTAIDLKEANHISIKNCYIRFPGKNGIEANELTNTLIDNCEFFYVNNIAINVPSPGSNYTTITNNLIEYTGTIPGMGQSGNLGYEGIVIYGNNNTLEYNTLDYIGSVGIEFQGSNLLFKNNVVNHFGLVKDDVGGIYTWRGNETTTTYTNRKIKGNVVLNGVGAGEGTNHPDYKATEGIYMDDNTHNVDITDNTVANCGNSGIFSHSSHELTIRKNTVYNNSRQLMLVQDHESGYLNYIRNNKITNNIFVSASVTQNVAEFISNENDISSFGTLDTNAYCRPLDDKLDIYSSYKIGTTYYQNQRDLAMWKAAYSKDAVSTASPYTYPAYTVTGPQPNKFSNSTFTTDTDGVEIYSATGSMSVAKVSSGGLDGGTAKVTYSSGSSSGVVSFSVGAFDASKQYILKFSLKSSVNNKTMNVYIQHHHSPYNRLSPISSCKISSSRTENEFLIEADSTDSDVSVIFEIDPTSTDLYVDNFQFYEATATMNNPNSYLLFEYNATKNNRTVALGSTNYKDARGTNYTGNITLLPFTSVVLFKQLSPKPAGITSTENEFNKFILYPNPASSTITISFEKDQSGPMTIQVIDLVGKVLVSEIKTLSAGEQIVQQDIASFAPGTYILKIQSGKAVSQAKFTKTN